LQAAVLHSLAGVQVVDECACTHWPTPETVSHPAIVQLLPSVSVHAVLGAFGVCVHWPVELSHAAVLHSLATLQAGHRLYEPVTEFEAAKPLSHVASPVDVLVAMVPASSMMVFGSTLPLKFFTVVSNVRVQNALLLAGMTRAGVGVNTSWFGDVPPPTLLLVQVVPAQVELIVASPE
jgi:hypothetical protein